jgi:hypothetical protein
MSQLNEAPKTGVADVEAASAGQFSEPQMRMLRAAVIGMAILLVVGLFTLIGRIIYLAKSGGATSPNTTVSAPPSPRTLAPEVRVALPAGAMIKATTISGDRLTITYSDTSGDGLVIVDLTTAQVVSRIRIERAP